VNDWIYDQLNSGNEWAWCMVKVTAEYDCKEGKDYLGACSYENKENFIKGGYYDDMVDSAIEDLIRIMDEIPEEAIDSETCKQCKGFGTSGKPGEASECKRCFGYGRMYYLRHPETTQ
jgi:hypothetical protein